MAQSKSENVPEIKSEDIDVLRAEAGHEDGGGGPTLSSDALYDDDTSRNDLNALAASFGVEYPEAYPSKKSLRKAAVEALVRRQLAAQLASAQLATEPVRVTVHDYVRPLPEPSVAAEVLAGSAFSCDDATAALTLYTQDVPDGDIPGLAAALVAAPLSQREPMLRLYLQYEPLGAMDEVMRELGIGSGNAIRFTAQQVVKQQRMADMQLSVWETDFQLQSLLLKPTSVYKAFSPMPEDSSDLFRWVQGSLVSTGLEIYAGPSASIFRAALTACFASAPPTATGAPSLFSGLPSPDTLAQCLAGGSATESDLANPAVAAVMDNVLRQDKAIFAAIAAKAREFSPDPLSTK